MRQRIENILISFVVALLTMYGVYVFVPHYVIETVIPQGEQQFGATLTTIQGTDTLKDSRVTINDNFTALNDAKIEMSTTSIDSITTLANLTTAGSLDTVGTLTTGTWNADTLTVSYGGTGSTTLTAGGALYGNGTGEVLATAPCADSEIIIWTSSVPGCGTSSVNTTVPYTWTAHHIFSSLFATEASTTAATSTDHYVQEDLVVDGALDVTNATLSGVAETASSTTFTTNGTYNKSSNVTKVFVEVWGGGASGGAGDDASTAGGGGGEYISRWFDPSELGASESITVGSGGARVASPGGGGCTAGNAGSDTTFGSLITADGGRAEGTCQGNPANTVPGSPGGNPGVSVWGLWGDATTTTDGEYGIYSGAGGGSVSGSGRNGGASRYGGGGGGGCNNNSAGSGGSSSFGGDGSACSAANDATDASNGTQPGGGGGARDSSNTGAESGAGGDGQVRVTEFF